jgi:hypothetical protein
MYRRRILCTLQFSSWFLISFVMEGSGSSRAIKFLLHLPPPPTVWSLKPPSWALVHKTTYASLIYIALCIMFWMRAYPLRGHVGGGWALEIESLLGPVKWHGAQKTEDRLQVTDYRLQITDYRLQITQITYYKLQKLMPKWHLLRSLPFQGPPLPIALPIALLMVVARVKIITSRAM